MLQKIFGKETLGVIDSPSWEKGLVSFWHFPHCEMQEELFFSVSLLENRRKEHRSLKIDVLLLVCS